MYKLVLYRIFPNLIFIFTNSLTLNTIYQGWQTYGKRATIEEFDLSLRNFITKIT